ncbi:hypothetical protein PVT67_16885 [Gallaecimonas kandeliae]|uniref:hypothetical protein n=1 Tax=Gallaecimonas kandeliae TaxID=3029055 RepID=UPI002647E6A5|nr:hypothetical protein [Gallaecimonas kandeliae]WKE65318.1 hypothetical protein PVT67_16885 [Gallaecimonas kandeliae]
MDGFNHNDKEIVFWSETGEVLSQNKYSETHVSSSGGGGHVGRNGGHVRAPKIKSTTVINHEIWIKKDDGKEKNVKLVGQDIPLREGQRVTLISAGVKGENSSYHSVLVNHNANKHWFINDADSLNQKLKIDLVTGNSVLLAGALWLFLIFLNQNSAVLLSIETISFVGFVIYKLLTKMPRVRKMKKSLDGHLESLAQQAYRNV